MFKNGNSTVIFKFLDEETSFLEDLQVIWRCPKMIFVKALFGRMYNYLVQLISFKIENL